MKSALEQKLKRRSRGLVIVQAARGGLWTLGGLLLVFYGLVGALNLNPAFAVFPVSPAAVFGLALGLPVFLALGTGLFARMNTRKLTLSLEHHYPRLRDRMLTLWEMTGGYANQAQHPFSRALVKSLESEMNTLLDRFGFGKAAALGKLIVPCVFACLFAFAMTVHAFVQPEFFRQGYRLLTHGNIPSSFRVITQERGTPLPSFPLEVTPGNCEIPKGSNLLIEAAVSGYTPQKVTLYVKQEEEMAWRFFPMKTTGPGRYQYLLTHVSASSIYYVKADHRESLVYAIKLFEPLVVKRAVWKLRFPDYMGLPEEQIQGWGEKMTVPAGTRFHVELEMNRDVKSGRMTAEESFEIPLKLKSPKILEADFELANDKMLNLEVLGAQGEPLANLPSMWIQALPDMLPYLEVIEPHAQNYVFPSEEVPFVINVEDDYGIASVALVLRVRGKEQRIEWLPEGKKPKKMSLRPVLELEKFGLHARDLVFAHLEVRDNYPGESHTIRSPLFSFLIRDYVEQFRVNSPPPAEPSLRKLFEDILADQETLVRDTWNYLSMSSSPAAIEIKDAAPGEKAAL
ncbi:MAG TPA: hypothetical protein VL688_12160 [Verrucomicrobiae bacterium]|nr:hypothetical protein [Verrucomicrobiae bacterium]